MSSTGYCTIQYLLPPTEPVEVLLYDSLGQILTHECAYVKRQARLLYCIGFTVQYCSATRVSSLERLRYCTVQHAAYMYCTGTCTCTVPGMGGKASLEGQLKMTFTQQPRDAVHCTHCSLRFVERHGLVNGVGRSIYCIGTVIPCTQYSSSLSSMNRSLSVARF
jgi:hypothetical protein